MKPWSTGKLALLLLTLAVTTVFALAVDGEEQQTKKTDKAPPAPARMATPAKKPASPAIPVTPAARTYTNDDLKRLFGDSASAPTDSGPAAEVPRVGAPAEQQPGKTALEQLVEQQKLEDKKREKIAEAEKALAAAEQRAAEVERRGLAVRNPFLKRPNVSEGEHKDWDKLDSAQRAQRTDEDMKKARDEVEAARRALDELRRTP